ncbi:late sigma transcription factor [Aeromonas phage Aes012]|uniref:RNA polymerase sigma-like factor n=6 Tax=Tulanevirus TaxID=2560244 RepID=A0A2S1PE20_9CAUD|nr:late sigma transcription factor [Aeromonas phage phiAS4]YP_007010738.1 late sigma transcription factor [Aeromonas phage Aes508]YP_007677765.1 late sigma transcription factor [Aeromonas phage Aes012]YP_009217495.1 late sigma transcription factor [Stenotrophomonas phage IME13]YP_009613141.1 late sigma transcription factor [Aeromonas phage AS-gz]YP_010095549.1 late sigma transcription factor [Aeromonas phage 50AhydR13PP]AFN69999.1 sigma factor [Aeromonas phage Aes516]UYD58039.1 RNA polymeras
MKYVDNEVLYQNICKWKQDMRDAGHHIKMPDAIGIDIMKIAKGFTGYYKFAGYTQNWKDGMISDAVEAVVKGLVNFDEENYKNPHAYITQACYRAFIGRIKYEKHEMAIKYRYFLTNVYDEHDEDMSRLVDENFIQDIHGKLVAYESSLKSKKKDKEDVPNLDSFYEDDPED